MARGCYVVVLIGIIYQLANYRGGLRSEIVIENAGLGLEELLHAVNQRMGEIDKNNAQLREESAQLRDESMQLRKESENLREENAQIREENIQIKKQVSVIKKVTILVMFFFLKFLIHGHQTYPRISNLIGYCR